MSWTFAAGLFCAAASTTAAIAPTRAYAGEPESKTLFAEGRQLRSEGKCAEAIIVFRRALETFPEGLGSLRNIAECEQELGLYASSRRDWNDLRVAVLQSRSPKYDGWDKDAEQSKAALDSKVGYATIALTGERPENLRIQVNGKTFDPRLLGVELEQDNGPLTVEVFYGGATPVSKSATISEGSHEKIVVEIPRGGSAGGPPTEDNSRANTARGMKIGGGIGIALGGLAAVGLGVSIGIRQDALGSVEKACPDPSKQCNDAADVNRGTTASTLINVFAVSAVVFVGAGITLVLAAPSDTAPKLEKKKDEPATGPAAPSATPQPTAPPPAPGASLELNLEGTYGGGFIGLGGHF